MITTICHQCECDIELKDEQQIPFCERCFKEVVIQQPAKLPFYQRWWIALKYGILGAFASVYRATGRFLIVRSHVRERAKSPDGSIIWEVYQTDYYDIQYHQYFEMREHAVHYNFLFGVLLVWSLRDKNEKENVQHHLEYLPKEYRLWRK